MTTRPFTSTHCPQAAASLHPHMGALIDSLLFQRTPRVKLKYKWCNVGVLDYDKEKKLYLVHKAVRVA